MARSISEGVVTWSAGGATCGNIADQTVGGTCCADSGVQVVPFGAGIACGGGGADITACDAVNATAASWTLRRYQMNECYKEYYFDYVNQMARFF